MERVQGIGGIFFKSPDPKALSAWYAQHLGVPLQGWGGAAFAWSEQHDPHKTATTVWSPFSADTQYFAPSTASFMINFRVASLDRMLEQLRAGGVTVDEKVQRSEYGNFGWCMDLDGNRVELWEPPDHA